MKNTSITRQTTLDYLNYAVKQLDQWRPFLGDKTAHDICLRVLTFQDILMNFGALPQHVIDECYKYADHVVNTVCAEAEADADTLEIGISARLISSVQAVVNYLWQDELKDYADDPSKGHIFHHLVNLDNALHSQDCNPKEFTADEWVRKECGGDDD